MGCLEVVNKFLGWLSGLSDSVSNTTEMAKRGLLAKDVFLDRLPNNCKIMSPTPSPQDFIRENDSLVGIQSGLKYMHVGEVFKEFSEELDKQLTSFVTESGPLFKNLADNQANYLKTYKNAKEKYRDILDYYEKNKNIIDKMKFIEYTDKDFSREDITKKEVKETIRKDASEKIETAKGEAASRLRAAQEKAKSDIKPLCDKLKDQEKVLNKELGSLEEKRKKYLEHLKNFFGINCGSDALGDKTWESIDSKFKSSYKGKWSYIKRPNKDEVAKAKKHYEWLAKSYGSEKKKLETEIRNLKEALGTPSGTFKAEALKRYCKGKDKKYLVSIEFSEYDLSRNNIENNKTSYTFKESFKDYQDDYNLLRGKYTGIYKHLEKYDSISNKGSEYKDRKKDIGDYFSNAEKYNAVMQELKEKIELFEKIFGGTGGLTLYRNNICKILENLKGKVNDVFDSCSSLGKNVARQMNDIRKKGLRFSKSESQMDIWVFIAYLSYVMNTLTEKDYSFTETALKFDKMEKIHCNLQSLDIGKHSNKQKSGSVFSKIFSRIKDLI